MYLKATALLALVAASYGSPAAADIPTDTAALESLLNNPGMQSSLSAAMSSFGSYMDANPGLMSSVSNVMASLSSGNHDMTSGASSAKSMAAAAVGASLFAALF
ncbi:hypothetical protein BX667DRAFT_517457 [Coemansia mojavensis]|nr:hypothetical protein BX667DRAFT_517457 [Coemansia mojavensis]